MTSRFDPNMIDDGTPSQDPTEALGQLSPLAALLSMKLSRVVTPEAVTEAFIKDMTDLEYEGPVMFQPGLVAIVRNKELQTVTVIAGSRDNPVLQAIGKRLNDIEWTLEWKDEFLSDREPEAPKGDLGRLMLFNMENKVATMFTMADSPSRQQVIESYVSLLREAPKDDKSAKADYRTECYIKLLRAINANVTNI